MFQIQRPQTAHGKVPIKKIRVNPEYKKNVVSRKEIDNILSRSLTPSKFSLAPRTQHNTQNQMISYNNNFNSNKQVRSLNKSVTNLKSVKKESMKTNEKNIKNRGKFGYSKNFLVILTYLLLSLS